MFPTYVLYGTVGLETAFLRSRDLSDLQFAQGDGDGSGEFSNVRYGSAESTTYLCAQDEGYCNSSTDQRMNNHAVRSKVKVWEDNDSSQDGWREV